MNRRIFRRGLGISFIMLLVINLTGTLPTTSLATPEAAPAQAGATYLPLILNNKPTQTFLPLVLNRFPPNPIFGGQLASVSGGDTALLKDLGVNWLRLNGPSWRDVQPEPGGAFRWDARSVQVTERALAAIKQRGINPRIVMVTTLSPEWATVDGSLCGPIKPEYYDDYGRFLSAAAARFNAVQYWEIANEPDASVEDVGPFSSFGCWGDDDDEYYGGREYGAMLKVVAPMIKQANRNAQVMNGGLLLFRSFNRNAPESLPGRFFEGMLRAGAGSALDIVNYHSYTSHYGPTTPIDGLPIEGDPVNDFKPRFLRDVMRQVGVPEKPLFNSEAALRCRDESPQGIASCHEAQANLMGRLYARAARDRLIGQVWYLIDSDEFNNTALIDPTNLSVKRPAYAAYKHARDMFGEATYMNTLSGQPQGVEGYQFKQGAQTITIVWSDQPNLKARIRVPPSAPRCTQRDGTPFTCANVGGFVELSLTSAPMYVVAP